MSHSANLPTTETATSFRATSLYANLCDKVLETLQAGPYRSGPPVLEPGKAEEIRGSFKEGRSNSKVTRTAVGSSSAASLVSLSLASHDAGVKDLATEGSTARQQHAAANQNPRVEDDSSGPQHVTSSGSVSTVTHTTSGSSAGGGGGSTTAPPPPPPPRAVWKSNGGGSSEVREPASIHHADPATPAVSVGLHPVTEAAAAAAAAAGPLSQWDTLSAAWTERSADYHLYVTTDPVTGQVYLEHLPDLIRIPSSQLPRVCQHICEVVWEAVSNSGGSRRAKSEEDTASSTVSSLSLSYVPVYRRQGSELYQSLCEGVWEVLSLGSDAPDFETMVTRMREEEIHARKVAMASAMRPGSPTQVPPLPPLVPPTRYPLPFTAQHLPDLVVFPLESISAVFSSVCDGVWDVVSLLSADQEGRLVRFGAERPKVDHLPPLVASQQRPPDTTRTAAPRERQAPVGCYHVHPVVSRPLHSILGVPSMRAKAIAETGGRGGLNALRLPPVVFRYGDTEEEEEEDMLNVRSVSSPPNPPRTSAAQQTPRQVDGEDGDDHRTFLSRPPPPPPPPLLPPPPASTPAGNSVGGVGGGGVSPLPFGGRGFSCPELDVVVASTVGSTTTTSTTTTTTTTTATAAKPYPLSSSTGSSATACISGFTVPSEYELPPGLVLSADGMPMFAPAPAAPPPPPPPVVYTSPIYLYRDECVKRERIFWEMIQESMTLFPWPMHPERREMVLSSLAYVAPDPEDIEPEADAALEETRTDHEAHENATAVSATKLSGEEEEALVKPVVGAAPNGDKGEEELSQEEAERQERVKAIELDKKQRRKAEQEKAIQDKALAEVEILQHPALILAQDYLDGVENFERKAIIHEEMRDLALVTKEYDYEHRLVTVGTLPLERVVRRWINQFRGRRLLQAKQREHLVEREALLRHELLTTDPDLIARHKLLHDAVMFLESAFRRQIDLLQLRTFYIIGNVQIRLLEHVERFPILFGGTMRKTRACARVTGNTVFVGNQLCEQLFRSKIEEMEAFERRAVLPFEVEKWSLVNVFEPPQRKALEEEEMRERAELEYRLQQLIVYYHQRDVEIYRAVTFDIELERPFKSHDVPVIDPFY